MSDLLTDEAGARVDGIFYCPHHLESCSCRKPGVGLFLQAKERWPDIDLQASAMVGDSENDVIAGGKLDMRTILLDKASPDLQHAVDVLLNGTG
jgi:D-glycero-D-manno-heptose 1,7-bisphosphate phosphatase